MMAISMRQGSKGFNECMSIARPAMTVIGVWPLEEHKGLLKQCQWLLPASLLLFFIIIPQTQKAILSHSNLNLMIEVLTTADIIESVALVKLFGLWYNKQDLKKLVTQMSDDWKSTTTEEQYMMWVHAKMTKWIAVFTFSTTIGSVIFHTIAYLISLNSSLTEKNSTAIRNLYLLSQFPFEVHHTPLYETICFCQFIGAFLSTFAYSSFDTLFVCSILHFSARLYNLRRRIPNLVTNSTSKRMKFTRVLKALVHEHQHLINFTDMIENNFNKVFLLQVMLSSVALCLQGYQVIMATSENDMAFLINLIFIIVYTASTLISIFVYCYVAEIIRTESENLFYAVYEMQWYNLPPGDSRLLLILMNRFMTPIQITIGKFAVFSLSYFATIIKTSVGYLSVLLAVKQKSN